MGSRGLLSAMRRAGWLPAIGMLAIMATGCNPPGKATLSSVTALSAPQEGIKITFGPVTTTPNGNGTTTVNVGGFVLDHDPLLGATNVRWRGSIWVDDDGDGVIDPPEDTGGDGVLDPCEDTNGNGVLDPGEIKVQGSSSPPPTGTPPGGTSGPAPPASGTFTVPTPTSGPTKGTVIIEIEYVDITGSHKSYKPGPRQVTVRF